MILLIPLVVLPFHLQQIHLNSIMILLIPSHDISNNIPFVKNLNSIMILLILITEMSGKASATAFKFHYDSINSVFHLRFSSHPTVFKFHYDSINSLFHFLYIIRYDLI